MKAVDYVVDCQSAGVKLLVMEGVLSWSFGLLFLGRGALDRSGRGGYLQTVADVSSRPECNGRRRWRRVIWSRALAGGGTVETEVVETGGGARGWLAWSRKRMRSESAACIADW